RQGGLRFHRPPRGIYDAGPVHRQRQERSHRRRLPAAPAAVLSVGGPGDDPRFGPRHAVDAPRRDLRGHPLVPDGGAVMIARRMMSLVWAFALFVALLALCGTARAQSFSRLEAGGRTGGAEKGGARG